MGIICSGSKSVSKSTNKHEEHKEKSSIKDKTSLNQTSNKVPCCTNITNDVEKKSKPKNLRFTKDDNMFCCSICFDVYNDKEKYSGLLLCGHTVCFQCIDQFNYNRNYYRCPFCKATTNTKPTKNYALMDIIEKQQLIIKFHNEIEIKYNSDNKPLTEKCQTESDHVFKYSEIENVNCHNCGQFKICSYCTKCDDDSLVNCYHCIVQNTKYNDKNKIKNGLYNINIFGCLCMKGKQNIQWMDEYSSKNCLSCNLNFYDYGVFACLNCNFNFCFSCYYEHYEKNRHKHKIPSPITGFSTSSLFPKRKENQSSAVTFNNRQFDKDFTFVISSKEDNKRKVARNLVENNINYTNNLKKDNIQEIEEFYHEFGKFNNMSRISSD